MTGWPCSSGPAPQCISPSSPSLALSNFQSTYNTLIVPMKLGLTLKLQVSVLSSSLMGRTPTHYVFEPHVLSDPPPSLSHHFASSLLSNCPV